MKQLGNNDHKDLQSLTHELKLIPELIDQIFGKSKFCQFFVNESLSVRNVFSLFCLLYLFSNTFQTSSSPMHGSCIAIQQMGIAWPCTVWNARDRSTGSTLSANRTDTVAKGFHLTKSLSGYSPVIPNAVRREDNVRIYAQGKERVGRSSVCKLKQLFPERLQLIARSVERFSSQESRMKKPREPPFHGLMLLRLH